MTPDPFSIYWEVHPNPASNPKRPPNEKLYKSNLASANHFIFSPPCAKNADAAQYIEIWHGWMNIQPCSRAGGYHDDFGNWWPNGIEWADQELHGNIYALVPSIQDLTNEVKNTCIQCGVEAAAVTTTVAILTGGGGLPLFNAAFWDCLDRRANQYVRRTVDSIELKTHTECDW